MTADERRYSEEEFAEILRRASELQARPRDAGTDDDEAGAGALQRPRGMSLDEIASIAREVGIEPDLVRQAAAAVATREVFVEGLSPDRFVLKRSIPGELNRDDLARVLTSVRDVAGVHGETTTTVSGVEWKGNGEVIGTVVSADTLDGKTEFRVAVDANSAKVLSHLLPGLAGTFGAAIIGAAVEPGLAGGIAVMAGGIATGLGTGRLIWNRVLARARGNAERLFRAGVGALPGHSSGEP